MGEEIESKREGGKEKEREEEEREGGKERGKEERERERRLSICVIYTFLALVNLKLYLYRSLNSLIYLLHMETHSCLILLSMMNFIMS